MLPCPSMFDLRGKCALVTGAGRADGIGAAIAKGLAQCGADVAIHVASSIQSGEKVRDEIRKLGVKSEVIPQDLSVSGAGPALIDAAQEAMGPLDILVLNATAQVNGEFNDVTPEQYDLQVNVNIRSTYEMLQSILPQMADRGWGRIVNIGSINQRSPKSVVSIYAATKAAQHNLIQSLARDYASKGVLLNTLAPGLIDTHAEDRSGDAEANKVFEEYAALLNWIGRAGLAEEIAGGAVFLSSPACSFMTGESMFLTGGQ